MFTTFQAGTLPSTIEGGDNSKGGRSSGASRRISTTNACVECRRRKIRCDGLQPCGQCQWYSHPESCAYAKPAQRVVPSRKLVDKLQSQIDQYHTVFTRLFPGRELVDFVPLPRAELIDLALTLPAANGSPDRTLSQLQARPEAVNDSHRADSLDSLDQAPEQDPDSDEPKRMRDKIQGIFDDVNGLSLSVDKVTSYVGVSSINAAMKVIFKTAPMARSFIAQAEADTCQPSRPSTPPPYTPDPDPTYLPAADVGERLIDSYFAHVHIMMPMINEEQFRHTYLYGTRRDPPWLSLLNMVLALGSLSGSTCDDEAHITYYQRARKHLEAETCGSGSLFTLQALALLSGYYLHWLNRPNEANGVMGATLRMATAHGLHREYSENRKIDAPGSGNTAVASLEVPVEIRRRTWWSLYILDSWASITTGRPSLGRDGDGITIGYPRIPEQSTNEQYLASLRLLPIIHNITFCKIATKVQDILAAHSIIAFDDLFALDADLEKWHDDLPPILSDVLARPAMHKGIYVACQDVSKPYLRPAFHRRTTSSRSGINFSQPPERDQTDCPEVLKTPRAIMHWRYQNLKILMHRPILLATALRRTTWANMTAEERLAVGRCRIVASQAIADIDLTCEDNLIAGWNAVWMMYQAVMIPLVSLFSVLAMPPNTSPESPSQTPGSNGSLTTPGSDDDIESWRRDVEVSIAFFDRMQRWSVAAKKSRDVVQRLYDATHHVAEHNAQYHQQQQELLKRRMSTAPITPVDAKNVAGVDLTTSFQMAFQRQHGPPVQDAAIESMTGAWSTSPVLQGEDAMVEFWDDMMWDSLPPRDANASLVENVGQTDWWPPVQGAQAQEWVQWNAGHPQQ